MKEKKPKESPKFAKDQMWKHKKTGAVITLSRCTKAMVLYTSGTRSMRATTLLRDYELVVDDKVAKAPKK